MIAEARTPKRKSMNLATCGLPEREHDLCRCPTCDTHYPRHYMVSSGHCYDCYICDLDERARALGLPGLPKSGGSIRDIAMLRTGSRIDTDKLPVSVIF